MYAQVIDPYAYISNAHKYASLFHPVAHKYIGLGLHVIKFASDTL